MNRIHRWKLAALVTLGCLTCTTVWSQQAVDPFSAGEESPEPELKIYELRNADAREMSKLLTDLLPKEARVSVDMRTNSIVVVADPEQQKIVTAVMSLDESKRATEQQPTTPRPQPGFKIFSLVNSDAQESSKLLSNLFPQGQLRVAVDVQTNSVIVSADAEEQLSVAEAVLLRLDEAAHGTEKRGPTGTRSFGFKHVDPNELNLRLKQVRSAPISFRVFKDQVTVTGPQSALDEVEALLRQLDRPSAPSRSMRVRIIWLLAANQEDASLKNLPAPPDDLKPVLEELADLSIKQPKLATQLVLYGVTGSQNLQLNGNISEPFPGQVHVTGELLDNAAKSPSLKLQISIAADSGGRPGIPAGGGRAWGEPMGTLNTQITTPPGHFVVLGAMPMNSLTSVFVVQVTPLEVGGDALDAAAQNEKAEAEKIPPRKVTPKR